MTFIESFLQEWYTAPKHNVYQKAELEALIEALQLNPHYYLNGYSFSQNKTLQLLFGIKERWSKVLSSPVKEKLDYLITEGCSYYGFQHYHFPLNEQKLQRPLQQIYHRLMQKHDEKPYHFLWRIDDFYTQSLSLVDALLAHAPTYTVDDLFAVMRIQQRLDEKAQGRWITGERKYRWDRLQEKLFQLRKTIAKQLALKGSWVYADNVITHNDLYRVSSFFSSS